MKRINNLQNQIKIYKASLNTSLSIPMCSSKIECGFPSPTSDYIEYELDLNKYVIKNPDSTFFARIVGYSMEEEGILPGDVVVIDKSITNYEKKICLCWYEDGFTIKKIEKRENKIYLVSRNKKYKKIEIINKEQLNIWGVVTFYFRKLL